MTAGAFQLHTILRAKVFKPGCIQRYDDGTLRRTERENLNMAGWSTADQGASTVVAALMGVFILVTGKPAVPQEAPKRDCMAAAAKQKQLSGTARRQFLVVCMRQGGMINCSRGEKLCGIDCILRAKECNLPDLRMQ